MKTQIKSLPFLAAPLVFWLLCAFLARTPQYAVAQGIGFNVFLALLPVLFIKTCGLVKNIALKYIFGALWLLFLPNTFYMITDLIHVPQNMEWVDSGWVVHHDSNIRNWIYVLIIGIGCVMAFILGLESMYYFFSMVLRRFNSAFAFIAAAGISLLCGAGIYIGRFLRFNSWDILNPLSFAVKVLESINLFSLQITAVFGAAIFMMFWLYIFLTKRGDTESKAALREESNNV